MPAVNLYVQTLSNKNDAIERAQSPDGDNSYNTGKLLSNAQRFEWIPQALRTSGHELQSIVSFFCSEWTEFLYKGTPGPV